MKKKIINVFSVLCHFNESNIEHDWSSIFARKVLKYTKKYDIECWFMNCKLKKIKCIRKSGITYRLFPAIQISRNRVISLKLLRMLRKQASECDILINLFDYHDYLSYLISLRFKNIPIAAKFLGSAPPLTAVERNPFLAPLIPILGLETIVEKVAFQNIDFFSTTQYESEYLLRFIKNKIRVEPYPVDFAQKSPISRTIARNTLNVDNDKKIMLYVGSLDKRRRCDVLVKTFLKLKNQYNIDFIVVGGKPGDEYYDFAKQSGVQILAEKVPNKVLPLYYSAANVYVSYGSKANIKHNGMGVAPTESLAANVPIVTPNIQNIKKCDIKRIGHLAKNEEELEKGIRYVLDNQKQFKKCRETAMKYYSDDMIIPKIVKEYERLFLKYYDQKI